MKVKIIAHTPNPEAVIAQAAKLCYSPVGVDEIMEKLSEEKIIEFVTRLEKIGHESPFEHVSFTFAIEGVSRALSHQLVRHRVASYSQQSQRYVKLEQFEYIVPPAIGQNEMAKDIFIETMKRDQEAYDQLVMLLIVDKIDEKHPGWSRSREYLEEYDERFGTNDTVSLVGIFKEKHPKEYNALEKEAIEDARYVFPNACETKLVFTMNVRSLYNFFSHRCCNRAQWEIRELADEILKQVQEIAPTLFKNAGAPCVKGKCPEGYMSCGSPRK